jgi:hypothetical protein
MPLVAIPVLIALRVSGTIPVWPIAVVCVGLAVLWVVLMIKNEDRIDAHFDEGFLREIAKTFAQVWFSPFAGQPSEILWETAWGFAWAAWVALLSYLALSWIASELPLALQIPFLVIFGAGIVAISAMLAKGEQRNAVVRFWATIAGGRFGAFMAFIALVIWYLSFFACLTAILQERELVELIPSSAASFDRIFSFYAWQALALVPLLDANETLRWTPSPHLFLYWNRRTGPALQAIGTGFIHCTCESPVEVWPSSRRP